MRVAVVGAGPAGFYAAQALLRRFPASKIDLLERLPVPFGLVRYGVAPDHPATRNVIAQFSRMVDENRARLNFFGNCPVDDKLAASLPTLYDATLFATGAAHARALPPDVRVITGAADAAAKDSCARLRQMPRRVVSASDFMLWLNGHPDLHAGGLHAQAGEAIAEVVRHARHIALIGAGNVAIDVSRLLLRPRVDTLATDLSPSARDGLAVCPASKVSLFARRAPRDAAWTSAALRELVCKIPSVFTTTCLETVRADLAAAHVSRRAKRSLTILADHAAALTSATPSLRPSRLDLHFERRLVQLRDVPDESSVRVTMRAPDDSLNEIECDALFLSLGFVAGSGPGPRVGWANSNATGIIGDNKWDAETVVEALDVPSSSCTQRPGISQWADDNGRQLVTWEGWKRIDAEEKRLAQAAHRPDGRVPIERVSDMLTLVGDSPSATIPVNPLLRHTPLNV